MKICITATHAQQAQKEARDRLLSQGHTVKLLSGRGRGHRVKFEASVPQPFTAASNESSLASALADSVFDDDMSMLEWCDAVVMTDPCSGSGYIQLGWACGAKKITVALLADGQEPELMIKMADKIAVSIDEVIEYLASAPTPALGPNQKRYETASQPHANTEAAEFAARGFYSEVSVLREKYNIPELLIVVGMNVAGNAETEMTVDACSFGDPRVAPALGSIAYREFTAPTIERAEKLKRLAGKEET